MLLGPWITMAGSLFSGKSGKKLGNLLHRINQTDLVFMKELIEAGKVKIVIDKRYPLNEVSEALRYYAEGHARGKVAITMEKNECSAKNPIPASYSPHIFKN
jgi:NADPH:quinone reductase-like Zn-dependent oxidoreductase